MKCDVYVQVTIGELDYNMMEKLRECLYYVVELLLFIYMGSYSIIKRYNSRGAYIQWQNVTRGSWKTVTLITQLLYYNEIIPEVLISHYTMTPIHSYGESFYDMTTQLWECFLVFYSDSLTLICGVILCYNKTFRDCLSHVAKHFPDTVGYWMHAFPLPFGKKGTLP